MQKIRKLRPWLVEFSEKYGDMLGVTFAGNGYRAIKGDEGTVFFKPEDRYRAPSKVKPELEKQFFESITDVIPLAR